MTFEHVREFNTTYEVAMRLAHPDVTRSLRNEAGSLRFKLIREEFKELLEAIEEADIIEVADALGDIEYVTHGAALVFGIDSEVNDAELLIQYQEWADEDNPLLEEESQDELLADLREAILLNDVDAGVEILASILYWVRASAHLFSIPLDSVVEAIHKSNMTKLGEDGKPIFREGDRKVMKGPNYQTPTEDIKRLLGVLSADTSN